MRPFDWKPLLTTHRVPFIDKGGNVKRGEFNIRCPWCGNADPSFHMGIDPNTGWYSCWRNRSQHSGKSPLRLIMRLLNVPYGKAREIAGLGEEYVDPEGFDAVMARLLGRDDHKQKIVKRSFLELDKYFKPIIDQRVLTRRHWNYLYTRGFDDEDIAALCHEYGLMAARDGRYASRLIIPYYLNGELVTWTARAIAPAKVRYLDLSVDEALVPAKETLYNHDCILDGGTVLCLVEGPMDALKIDFYGKPYGVRAVACSTNSLTEHQTYMLEEATGKFEYIGVMMDNKTSTGVVDNMRMKQSLTFLPRVRTLTVPGNKGDAGEAMPREVKYWAERLVRSV